MRFLSALVISWLALSPPSWAEGRRALLVGINTYQAKEAAGEPKPEVVVAKATARRAEKSRGTWIDLDGSVNDIKAMHELLVARFGFTPDSILVLQDGAAGRDAILDAFRKHIIEGAKPGEAALFFYAGHGSQVRNSKTDEPDGLDETIVPADSAKGAFDIRDKELARLYNAALDKKILLTVISDSCHSGSVARGLPLLDKQRSLPPDPRDVAEAPTPGPAPEERGLLVLSAAQDYQTAGETTDERGDQHGVFSNALLKTLQAVAVDEPAERVFLRVKAMMQSEGRPQEPVIAGSAERRQGPLFGGSGGKISGRTTVPVLRQEEGIVTLQAGSAVGLRERCELKKVGGAKDAKPVRIRVTAIKGLGLSEAEAIEGDVKTVRSGDLFEVERWVVGDAALRVWLAPGPAQATLKATLAGLAGLRTAAGVKWIEDPTAESPTHVISWASGAWTLTAAGKPEALGPTLKPDVVLKRITGGKVAARLFVQLPPPAELAAELKLGAGTENDAIARAASPGEAQYLLVGRWRGGEPEYAWVRPNASQENALALPPRTDWVETPAPDAIERTAGALEDQALRLAKLRSWLPLGAPADEGRFPYRLALKNVASGQVRTDGTLLKGESYGVVLQANPKDLAKSVEKRFVYVFSIDSFGNSALIFPRAGAGNVENRVPYDQEGATPPPAQIELARARFRIGPPFGTDTYVLLSSVQPIGDPDVLQFQGVRTRGAPAADANPLGRLLGGVGSATRGAQPETPADWSLERLVFRSASAP
jgi:hypothetical protein